MADDMADGGWSDLRESIFPDRPDEQVALMPMWNVTAICPADGEVESPAGYADPDGPLEFFCRKAVRAAPSVEQMRAHYHRWFYHESRHVDRRRHVEHAKAGLDVPRPVSDTYGDAETDWRVVMDFRDRILAGAGLAGDSPTIDIVRVFAEELYRNWRGGGARNHPADVLTHRSWCLGAANATMAILESLGIPARAQAVSEHCMAEAFVDGAWRGVDSSNLFINHPPGSTFLFETDFLELSANPTSSAHGDAISDYHRGIFYHYPRPHVGIPDGRWLRETTIEYCPASAFALYPRRTSWRFKTLDPDRLEILQRDKVPSVHHFKLWHDLGPGQRLRESVWLDDLDDVERFEWELRFRDVDGRLPDAETMRGLFVNVNGERLRVADVADWPMELRYRDPARRLIDGKTRDAARLTVFLPKGMFAGGQVNWIGLENVSTNDSFRIPLLPGVMKPYVSPLWRG